MDNVSITLGLPDDKLDEIANLDLDVLSTYLRTLSIHISDLPIGTLRNTLANRYLYLVSVYAVRAKNSYA